MGLTLAQRRAITETASSRYQQASKRAKSRILVGAVDVSYCREGGIAHSVRRFTICTHAGDKDCKGRTNGK